MPTTQHHSERELWDVSGFDTSVIPTGIVMVGDSLRVVFDPEVGDHPLSLPHDQLDRLANAFPPPPEWLDAEEEYPF